MVLLTGFSAGGDPFGHIGVNAGIDRPIVGDGRIQLLPKTLQACGLPFRTGVAGVAVGRSGIAALWDWLWGKCDLHDKVLEITLEAIIDEIAAAANRLRRAAASAV